MAWVDFRSKSLSYNKDMLFRKGYKHIEADNGKTVALSPRQRLLVAEIHRSLKPWHYLRRKALAQVVRSLTPDSPEMKDGYLLTSITTPKSGVIAVCERQIALHQRYLKEGPECLAEHGIDPAVYAKEMAKTLKDPLKHVPYRYNPDVTRDLVEFCVRPQMVAIAAKYLGVLPVLGGVRILYSPNANTALSEAQLFHIDPEGHRQVKMFMAIRPVGEGNGPFTLVSARQTKAMTKSGEACFQMKRVKDEDIERYAPRSDWIQHTGGPGDAIFVDTSSCFHFGSRPSGRPRFLLYAQFFDPFCSVFPVQDPLHGLRKSWGSIPREASMMPDYLLARKL